jgi:hypothetical protein
MLGKWGPRRGAPEDEGAPAQERHRDGLTQRVLKKHTRHAFRRVASCTAISMASFVRPIVSSAAAEVAFLREGISSLADSTLVRLAFCEAMMKNPRGQTYKIYLVHSNCSPPAVHVVSGLGGARVLLEGRDLCDAQPPEVGELPPGPTRPAFSLHLGS